MKTFLCISALIGFQIGVTALPASAADDHPTVRAAHRYAHRKAAHVTHAVTHVRAHYHNWKSRKGHNVRQWLNNH